MTRNVIAPSIYLGEVHHALVCSCDRLPIAPNIKGGGVGRVIMKHLKLFSVLAHWHIFVLLIVVLLKGDTSL